MERHIPSFDEFVNESEVNELLKIDLKKLNDFVDKVANKIKDSKIVSDVKPGQSQNQSQNKTNNNNAYSYRY